MFARARIAAVAPEVLLDGDGGAALDALINRPHERTFVSSWVHCKRLVKSGGPCYLLPQP